MTKCCKVLFCVGLLALPACGNSRSTTTTPKDNYYQRLESILEIMSSQLKAGTVPQDSGKMAREIIMLKNKVPEPLKADAAAIAKKVDDLDAFLQKRPSVENATKAVEELKKMVADLKVKDK